MFNLLLVFGDWGITFLRVVLGLIMFVHGKSKIKSLKKTGEGFETMGFRPGIFWATVVTIVEFLGGLFLIFGFLTQVVAFVLAIQFLVILFTVKRKAAFQGGLEFDLLILAVALALMVLGSGNLSIDRMFFGF
jgi:putative oxidoreductase